MPGVGVPVETSRALMQFTFVRSESRKGAQGYTLLHCARQQGGLTLYKEGRPVRLVPEKELNPPVPRSLG